MSLFRIWADYTVQEIDEYEEPLIWKSDDYTIIEADDEQSAIEQYKRFPTNSF